MAQGAATKPVPNGLAYPAPIQYPNEEFLIDGAITLLGGGIAYLTKAGAGAYTLAAPAADGVILRVISQTAQAHVITATNLINGNDDTATFGGAIGDCVEFYSSGDEWFTGPLINVTIA